MPTTVTLSPPVSNQPKVITKNPVTSSWSGNGPNYEIVFTDANTYDYFEIDVSQLSYTGIDSKGVWVGFSKFETKVHQNVELLVIVGGWLGKRTVISYRIPSNSHLTPNSCGFCVKQKHHSYSDLIGWRSGLSFRITDGEIDVKQNGQPLINHKSSFIKKNDFKYLVVGTKNGSGGKWTVKAVKT